MIQNALTIIANGLTAAAICAARSVEVPGMSVDSYIFEVEKPTYDCDGRAVDAQVVCYGDQAVYACNFAEEEGVTATEVEQIAESIYEMVDA